VSSESFEGWLIAIVVSVAIVVAVWVSAMWVLNLLDPPPKSRRRRWYSGFRKRWTK
jgi:hypothetical protein